MWISFKSQHKAKSWVHFFLHILRMRTLRLRNVGAQTTGCEHTHTLPYALWLPRDCRSTELWESKLITECGFCSKWSKSKNQDVFITRNYRPILFCTHLSFFIQANKQGTLTKQVIQKTKDTNTERETERDRNEETERQRDTETEKWKRDTLIIVKGITKKNFPATPITISLMPRFFYSSLDRILILNNLKMFKPIGMRKCNFYSN